MEYEKQAKLNELFKEPYPTNLLLTVNEDVWMTSPMSTDNITQDNFEGLEYALSTLTDREQEMVRLRFEERKTYKAIGEAFGISLERARYLVNFSIRKLRTTPLYLNIKYGKKGYEERRIRLAAEREKKANDIMQIQVRDMGLSIRPTNRLIAVGCNTVKDVSLLTKAEIKDIKNLGKLSVQEVKNKLESMGIKDTDWSKF